MTRPCFIWHARVVCLRGIFVVFEGKLVVLRGRLIRGVLFLRGSLTMRVLNFFYRGELVDDVQGESSLEAEDDIPESVAQGVSGSVATSFS